MDVTIGGCEVNFILTGFHRLRLVGGLEHLDYFSIRLGISYSQLMKSYFSEGLKPPTRYVFHGFSQVLLNESM